MGTEVIKIIVPGTPKPLERNRHRIIHSKTGGAFVSNYLPAKSRNEQAVIRDFAARAMAGRSPFEGAIDLRVMTWLPVPASWSQKKRQAALDGVGYPITKPDLDNIAKHMDAFKMIVWRDDSQVVNLHVWKRYGAIIQIEFEIRVL